MEDYTFVNDLSLNGTEEKVIDKKLAKISNEKLNNVRLKIFETRKTFKVTAGNMPKVEALAPAQAPSQQTTNSSAVEKPIAPPVETKTVSQPVNNYDEIINKFGMHVYENSVIELPLAAARKVRTGQRILNPLENFVKTKANGLLLVSKKEEVVNTLVEPKVDTVIKEETFVDTNEVVNEAPVISKPVVSQPTPSVDDYLQKEQKEVHQDNSISGLITQLEGDINTLKNEAIVKHEELKQLEAKFEAIQAQKKARIEELKEEKLSYTTTLEGLTEQINKLQQAIRDEENVLGKSKAA